MPTNHLDMRAKDILLESLMEFSGTLVFVSHDRYFIDRLATRVFEIADGEVRVYPGNYEDYLYRKSGVQPDLSLPGLVPAHVEPHVDSMAESAPAAIASTPRRLNPLKLRQLEDRLAALEAESARLEAEIAKLETALQSFVSLEESLRQTSELDVRRSRLNAILKEWEDLSLQLEEAR